MADFSQRTKRRLIAHSGMIWAEDGTPNGIPIARMARETERTAPTERDANCQWLVHCANNFEALVHALELCRELLEDSETKYFISTSRGNQAPLHAALHAASKAAQAARAE